MQMDREVDQSIAYVVMYYTICLSYKLTEVCIAQAYHM